MRPVNIYRLLLKMLNSGDNRIEAKRSESTEVAFSPEIVIWIGGFRGEAPGAHHRKRFLKF